MYTYMLPAMFEILCIEITLEILVKLEVGVRLLCPIQPSRFALRLDEYSMMNIHLMIFIKSKLAFT